MTDLPVVNLDFIANGQKYIGIDGAYLPFSIPSVNFEITFCGVKVKSTKTTLEKINFPFGTTIEASNGIIGYVISDEDGIYVPYYQKSGWYNDNDRVLNITGGEDIESQEVIDWFKAHSERVK